MQEQIKPNHYDRKETEEFAKDIAKFELKTGFELGAEEKVPIDAGKKPSINAGKKPPADVEKKSPSPSKKNSKIAIAPVIDEKFPPPIDPKVVEEV